jgi:hypothetical protein
MLALQGEMRNGIEPGEVIEVTEKTNEPQRTRRSRSDPASDRGILRVLCDLRGSMVLPLSFSVSSVTSVVRKRLVARGGVDAEAAR